MINIKSCVFFITFVLSRLELTLEFVILLIYTISPYSKIEANLQKFHQSFQY